MCERDCRGRHKQQGANMALQSTEKTIDMGQKNWCSEGTMLVLSSLNLQHRFCTAVVYIGAHAWTVTTMLWTDSYLTKLLVRRILAKDDFEPSTSELWTQHVSAASLCWQGAMGEKNGIGDGANDNRRKVICRKGNLWSWLHSDQIRHCCNRLH